MPSKRIRSTFPLLTGGGGGATTLNVPTSRWDENVTVDDALVLQSLLAEDFTVGDDITLLSVRTLEDINTDDSLSTPLITPAYAEDVTVNDLAKVRFVTVDVARSGTTDSNPMFDAYGDQALGTTNFGNANLSVKKNTVAGATEKRGWLCVDLTNYGPWTAQNAGLTLTFQAATSLLVGTQAMTWTATWTAAKPFVESTVTFNALPTAGTAMTSGSVAVANIAGSFTATITAAQLQAALGNWLTFTFTVTDAADLGLETVTVTSRDQAANRPTYTIDFLQRGT